MTNAPWFVTNEILRRDLAIISVKNTVKTYAVKYALRLCSHPNQLASKLLIEKTDKRRLKRIKPLDSSSKFE